MAALVPCHEIPAPAGGDELMGFDESSAVLTVTSLVVKTHLLAVSTRHSEQAERVGIDDVAVGRPLHRGDV